MTEPAPSKKRVSPRTTCGGSDGFGHVWPLFKGRGDQMGRGTPTKRVCSKCGGTGLA